MKSPGRWILIRLIVAGARLAYGLIPQSEEYSDWGFGDEGLVDVQCGGAFSEDVEPQFRDFQEGEQYRADRRSGYNPRIFEGQTADEVCEDLINGVRVVAIAGLAGGAVLAFIGIVGAAGAKSATATLALDDAPPPPVDEREVLRSYQLEGRPFFLYPAITYPHKNHETLVRALSTLVGDRPDVVLVLTGGVGPAEDLLASSIDACWRVFTSSAVAKAANTAS